MDFKAQINWLFHESLSQVTEPAKFWKKKSAEGFSHSAVVAFFMPLVLLVGLTVILGEIFWNDERLWSYILLKGLREVISYFLQFYASAYVLYRLLVNFKGTNKQNVLSNVLAYSLLPFLVASMITGLFPGLYVLGIIGLYGFYLFILGSQYCLDLPKENQSRFIILSILMIVLIFGTINIISWKLFQALFPYGA